MKYIKGPDFPTGGIVQGIDGIKKAYETGKGKVIVRSKVDVEKLRNGRQQLIVTEIPYEVNKSSLVKRIDELRADKKVDGIVEVRDETDRTGLRIAIELKKMSMLSPLRTTFSRIQIYKSLITLIWWQLVMDVLN